MADFDPKAFLGTSDSFDPKAFLGDTTGTPGPVSAAPVAPEQSSNSGDVPEAPLNEAGLSVVQRAMLGWAGHPTKQAQWLKEEFGDKNVKLQPGGQWTVKGQDGKWRMADPTGWSDAPGEVMQWLGDKGAVSGGAMAGGIAGAKLLGTGGAMAMGPIGGLAGLVVGGAGGALIAKLGEAGIKKAAGNVDAPHDIDELQSQLAAAMVFGAEQEGLGFLGGKVLGAGAKGLGAVLNRIGRTDVGITARAMLTQAMSGMSQPLARIWAENPMAVAAFQQTAIKDLNTGSNVLRQKMEQEAVEFTKVAKTALQNEGKEFGEIATEAAKHSLEVQPTLMQSYAQLAERGYVDAEGNVIKQTANAMTPELEISGKNLRALNKTLTDMKVFERAAEEGRGVSYDGLRVAMRNIDTHLKGVTDNSLRGALSDIRNAIKTNIQNQLDSLEPALGARFKEVNEKYGPMKDLVDLLEQKVGGGHADTLINQIIRQDGSRNSELLASTAAIFGKEDPTLKILRMAAAEDSAHIFVNRGALRFAGFSVGRSPRMAAAALKGEMVARQAVSEFGQGFDKHLMGGKALPYMTQVYKTLKSSAQGVRRMAVENPETVQGIRDLVMGAMRGEDDEKARALQETGL